MKSDFNRPRQMNLIDFLFLVFVISSAKAFMCVFLDFGPSTERIFQVTIPVFNSIIFVACPRWTDVEFEPRIGIFALDNAFGMIIATVWKMYGTFRPEHEPSAHGFFLLWVLIISFFLQTTVLFTESIRASIRHEYEPPKRVDTENKNKAHRGPMPRFHWIIQRDENGNEIGRKQFLMD